MHIRSLKHILEAVKALVHPARITVMGSSSLLAHEPSLGETGQPLELSMDADILVEPSDEGQAAVLHEAVGEGSLFHREYGVYADLLRPDIEETLPPGWRDRCVTIEGMEHVGCLEPHDLAVAKLALGRAKDIALLRGLLARGTIDLDVLRARYRNTPMDEKRMFRAGRTLTALGGPPPPR
jgi:hypothetical protein